VPTGRAATLAVLVQRSHPASDVERNVAWREKMTHRALRDIEKMVELDPDSAEGWLNLGGLLPSLQRTEEALAAYQRAIELAPDGQVYAELVEMARMNLASIKTPKRK